MRGTVLLMKSASSRCIDTYVRRYWRGAALAAVMLCAACAPVEPPPRTPVGSAPPQPYRGMPDRLLMSADGRRIAVIYIAGNRVPGVAVVDARSGEILLVRERVTPDALSPHGDRMLWRTPACRSPSGCSPTQLLETEVASGRDTVLGEAPPRLSFLGVRLVGYDPQNEDRIVLLLPPRRLGPDYITVSDRGRVVHIDRSRPGVIERMFTLDASDDRDLLPKAVSPGGGIVAVLTARPVTHGGDSIVTFRPPPLPNSTPVRSPARVEMLRLAADGQRMLVFVTTSYQDAETQDAALLEPRSQAPQGFPPTHIG